MPPFPSLMLLDGDQDSMTKGVLWNLLATLFALRIATNSAGGFRKFWTSSQ